MLVVPASRKLVIDSPSYAQVASVIPHAKAFTHDGQNLLALHHGVEESLVLKNFGFSVPAPILSYYAWPARFTAMEHQKDTASFLTMNKRALVLNAPGTGKTLSAIWAADFLLDEGIAKRILIIAPLSTLTVVWGRELYHHLPHRAFKVVTGDRKKREELLATPGCQYFIINHDGFTNMQDALNEFDVVIYDEATALKSPSSQRYKVFAKWMAKHDPWLWLLTGTPISQSPADAWTLARLVNSPNCPKSYTAFKDMVMQKITTFKWAARPDALTTCKKVLQPSIRFSLDECKDLPETNFVGRKTTLTAQQKKAFKEMQEKAVTFFSGAEVAAPNAAVVLAKLLQICCIAKDTPVLTRAGWKHIQDVGHTDILWDGEEWVSCDGSALLGYKPVVQLAGVQMTPDHKVLSTEGWAEAKEFLYGESRKRITRAGVRLPDGYRAGGVVRGAHQESAVAMRVPVWGTGGTGEPVSSGKGAGIPTELRMPPREREAQNGAHPPIRDMGKYAPSVLRPLRQGLEKLWGAGHHGMRKVAGVVRALLGGYGDNILPVPNAWAQRQRAGVHPRELLLGNCATTGEQPARQCADTNTSGGDDRRRCGEGVRDKAHNTEKAFGARGHGVIPQGSVAVYDVLNCGPRNRFVVRGAQGELSIVHNCGVVYADSDRVAIDAGDRYNTFTELLDEIGGKVIVFCPLRGVQDWLYEALQKGGYDVATVHGDVSRADRNQIFNDFQHTSGIRVLLAHPRVAAHGLTLTAAKDIIWFAPIYSLEQYEQANARIRRLSTEGKTTVWHIYATPFEAELYRRLRAKQKVLGEFLNLVNGVNDEF